MGNMVLWYRLVGQLLGLLQELVKVKVVSGYWWYGEDTPHLRHRVAKAHCNTQDPKEAKKLIPKQKGHQNKTQRGNKIHSVNQNDTLKDPKEAYKTKVCGPKNVGPH